MAHATPMAAHPTATGVGDGTSWVHWLMLAGLAGLALMLRLVDATSSPVMGAEDPYRHMERTWDLLQGKFSFSYPPGLQIMLAPFALAGPSVFYAAARFLPSLFGVSMVVGAFVLCRRYVHPAGALTAAALLAVMPETIRRTDILFPTAVDLGILPWLLLAVLMAADGSRRALVTAGVLGAVVLVVHPWLVALLLLPMAVFTLCVLWRRLPAWRTRLVLAACGFAAVCLVSLAVPAMADLVVGRGFGRLAQLASHPSSINPLPVFVDLPAMLTVPALLLGGVGAALAIVRRSRFSLLALGLALFMLPFVLVDWFGIWYIPHRTVAYLAIPLAMLAALPVAELFAMASNSKRSARAGLAVGVVALTLALTVPTAMATAPWYRIYESDDLQAWGALHDRGTDYVLAGSWQARTGYRAFTAGDAQFNPGFFQDPTVRDYELRQHPHMVVLVDKYTTAAGLPTGFLSSWHEVGHWGTTAAYTRT
ncbi:MAG: hypothetical protein V4510_08930 [bacterium]